MTTNFLIVGYPISRNNSGTGCRLSSKFDNLFTLILDCMNAFICMIHCSAQVLFPVANTHLKKTVKKHGITYDGNKNPRDVFKFQRAS